MPHRFSSSWALGKEGPLSKAPRGQAQERRLVMRLFTTLVHAWILRRRFCRRILEGPKTPCHLSWRTSASWLNSSETRPGRLAWDSHFFFFFFLWKFSISLHIPLITGWSCISVGFIDFLTIIFYVVYSAKGGDIIVWCPSRDVSVRRRRVRCVKHIAMNGWADVYAASCIRKYIPVRIYGITIYYQDKDSQLHRIKQIYVYTSWRVSDWLDTSNLNRRATCVRLACHSLLKSPAAIIILELAQYSTV